MILRIVGLYGKGSGYANDDGKYTLLDNKQPV